MGIRPLFSANLISIVALIQISSLIVALCCLSCEEEKYIVFDLVSISHTDNYMAETSENHQIMTAAPRLVHKLDKSGFSNAKINNWSSLQAIDHINGKLTEKQKSMFKETCFGHFLAISSDTSKFSDRIVLKLLEKEVECPNPNEMLLLVGGKTIKFSIKEFCMITGLKCSPCFPKVEDNRLLHKDLNGNMELDNTNLETTFLEAALDDEAMVKLALLYFLEMVLLGREKKSSIDSKHLSLVEDLHQFNKYPWGTLCFQMTLNSLKKAIHDQKSDEDGNVVYNLTGFPYAFQVWAYESIPCLIDIAGYEYGHGCFLPRMVNWWSITTPEFNTVQKLLDQKNLQVNTVLELTEREKEKDYLRHFVRPASYGTPSTNALIKLESEEHEVRVKTELVEPYIERSLGSSSRNFSMQTCVQLSQADTGSTMEEQEAVFAKIMSLLNSPLDLIQSVESTSIPPEEINKAKNLLKTFLSMDFNQLSEAGARDQLESSLDLLLECNHFPPHVQDTINSFRQNLVSDMEEYSNCCRRINRFDKFKSQSEAHMEELARTQSRVDQLFKEMAAETEESERIKQSIALMNAEAKGIEKEAQSSIFALARCLRRSKRLEEEKQKAEKENGEIEESWDKFKKETMEYVLDDHIEPK